MNGELDFKASLVERVALLKGQSTDIFNKVLKRINFTDGVRDLCLVLKSFGIKMAVVSGKI
jgi:phosphoserine phosphatase